MAGCHPPNGLHAHVLSALQPLRIPQTSSGRERRVRDREREGEIERERESELATLAFGRLTGGLSVDRSARCLSGWLADCSTGRASGWMTGWPAGRQVPGMDDWLPSRLPTCIPARRLPCGAEPVSMFAIFSPCAVRCRERKSKGSNGFRLAVWLAVRAHV